MLSYRNPLDAFCRLIHKHVYNVIYGNAQIAAISKYTSVFNTRHILSIVVFTFVLSVMLFGQFAFRFLNMHQKIDRLAFNANFCSISAISQRENKFYKLYYATRESIIVSHVKVFIILYITFHYVKMAQYMYCLYRTYLGYSLEIFFQPNNILR